MSDPVTRTSSLLFYAVTGTSRLRSMGPAPAGPPALCQIARSRNYQTPYIEPEVPSQGEMQQPAHGPEWNLDAGRSWRVYSVSGGGWGRRWG
jgi:hypothetical protein